MTEIQRLPQPGPTIYPPPPPLLLHHPYSQDPSPRHLPPVHPGPTNAPPLSSAYPPNPYGSPPLQQSPASSAGHERWGSGASLSRLLSSPTYTSPRSDPLFSPRHTYGVSPRLDGGGRTLEGPSQSKRPRLDIQTYPSPTYNLPPSRERSYSSSTTSPANFEAPPKAQPALVSHETRPARSPGHYEIKVRQQPLAARACGFGERDRRVIDPPPIVQLVVKEPRSGAVDSDELRYPFNVVHCTLWNEHDTVDETALHSHDRKVTRRLMGTLVSSPFVGLDENDQEGCFFCFPDLSCRTNGRYRLRFVLMRIGANELEPGGWTPIITETTSDVFSVFTAKDFPGMRASTALTKALKRQGCAISVKKGNEKANVQAKEEESGDDETAEATVPAAGGAAAGSKRKRKR